MKANFSPQKSLAVILSVLVLAVVVGGIWMAGTPAAARREQIDQQRVNHLQSISAAVDSYYESEGRLPESLEVLKARMTQKGDGYFIESTTDPVTKQEYEYRVEGATSYELCATFAAPTPEGKDEYGNPLPVGTTRPTYPGQRIWDHPAGHACFSIDASVRIPTVACSLTNPCVAPNTTCAQLPGRGTYCVPQGKECEAAGCRPGACTIRESYPAQISCIDDPNMVIPPAHPEPLPGSPEDPLPNDEGRPVTCNLMRHQGNGEMACFGCGSKACTKPGPEWQHYEQPEGTMGIPYSCYDDERGFCALAQ